MQLKLTEIKQHYAFGNAINCCGAIEAFSVKQSVFSACNLLLSCSLCISFNLSVFTVSASAVEVRLSKQQAIEVGNKVWRNECGGRIDGLTSWNAGEEFPSLGIGHFIWYPEGVRGPFQESFPSLLSFLQERQEKLPSWLSPSMACPWDSRDIFLADRDSARMVELRTLLSSTVGLQTEFIVQRLQDALPKMLEKASPESRVKVKKQFDRVLAAGGRGAFALIDYVNFKGEGILETERYKGKGWGLLQVLESMDESGDAVNQFSTAARKMLERRVLNSPPARQEQRWLRGWTKRVNSY